jgi:CRP-like cAMP-binding protein
MKPVMSQNRFLARLPRALQEVFDTHSEITEVRKGQLGDFADDDEEFVFFPLTCLYSVDIRMTDGFQAHLALLGYRHALGTRYRSEPPLPGAARVIVSGYALRLPVDIFVAEWSRSVELQRSLHDQLFQMTRMLGIATACNMHHPLQRRLAKWLLSAADASSVHTFELTHEELASLLGVRREAVTESLSRLSLAGAIETTRGRVSISDRHILSKASCECHDLALGHESPPSLRADSRKAVAMA